MPRRILLTYYSCAAVSEILKTFLIATNPYFVFIIRDLELDSHIIPFFSLNERNKARGQPAPAKKCKGLFSVALIELLAIPLLSEIILQLSSS